MADDNALQRDIPFLIGHRGACGHAPENTLPSLRRASELGVGWVEVDVKLSADGVPLLMHDDGLERTTDGTGNVCDTEWAALSLLDAGSWFSDGYAGTRLLRFDDAVGHLAVLNLGCNIELKPCRGREAETAETVCGILRKHWPGHLPPPLLSSFADESLAVVRDLTPEYPRALISDAVPEDWGSRLDGAGASALHVWHEVVDADDIRSVIASGTPVRTFTVNQRTRAVELTAMGFSGIFSDFPERMTGVEPTPGDAV